MPRRGRKKKQSAELPESSGETQATAGIDHAFASIDNPKRRLHGLKKLTSKQWFVIGLVLLVLAGGFFAAWYVGRKSETDKQNQAFKTLMSNVKDLRNEGKDDLARVQLLQFNKKYPNQTKDQRYLLANEVAAIYKTAGDYKNAVGWQRIAVENSPNPAYGDYLALGEAYALNGDNAQAVKYLQLALDKLKGDSGSDGGPEGRFLQAQIEKLKQEKP